MSAGNRPQQATARLAQLPAYQGELSVLSGDLPREMVKQIKREMKSGRPTTTSAAHIP